MNDYFDIGMISNTHGVKGELKIVPLTDDPQRYNKLKWVFVDRKGSLEKYNIETVKFFKNFVILKFKEISDMSAAEKLKGFYLKVDRENAVKLPKDSFFMCDLIGCAVFDMDENLLGEVNDIIKTGSNDVLVVKSENNKEILIPALKSVVKVVSIENKKINVSLPEGLVEDEI